MKRTAEAFFNIACIIGVIVTVWHFSVPYSSTVVLCAIIDKKLSVKLAQKVYLKRYLSLCR